MQINTMSKLSSPKGLHPLYPGLKGTASLAVLFAGSLWATGCGEGSSASDARAADASIVDASVSDASIADASIPDAACLAGVAVVYTGDILPAALAGFYDEAFDCIAEEGGINTEFSSHCFRKSDASTWRIWNTGCGWEIGLQELVDPGNSEETSWERHARTYTGSCSAISPIQLTAEALTTDIFVDGFGDPIVGVSAVRRDCLP